MPKKKWSIPCLTVLVKGKPEERVLMFCKGSGGGPHDLWASCEGWTGGCFENCASWSFS